MKRDNTTAAAIGIIADRGSSCTEFAHLLREPVSTVTYRIRNLSKALQTIRDLDRAYGLTDEEIIRIVRERRSG